MYPKKWAEGIKDRMVTFPLWSSNGPRPLGMLGGGASNLHVPASFSGVVCGLLLGEGGAL